MAISANFEQYDINSQQKFIKTQSIVECRLADWSQNKILAVNATVSLTSSESLSGEIHYGGKIYFSVLASTPEGLVTGAERAVEFSHKLSSDEIAPATPSEITLKVEKVEIRIDGKSQILSAIVSATATLLNERRIFCLTGGENVVINDADAPVKRVNLYKDTIEIEEEFETEYLGDVLSHSESAYINKVIAGNGSVEISGEIALGILAKRAGEKELVSFERLVPFKAEIPAESSQINFCADANAFVKQVNISANCDEDKNKSEIIATALVEVCLKVYENQSLLIAKDAFSPTNECEISKESITFDNPKTNFCVNEKVSGTSALVGEIDFSCNMQAVTAPQLEITAQVVENGEIVVEGVLGASILFTDSQGMPSSVVSSLPFAFPVKCEKAQKGDKVAVSGIVCGIYAKQKREGEIEIDATLKTHIKVYTPQTVSCVCKIDEKEEIPEKECAISVYLAEEGDGLWEVAKKLKKPPEEVKKYNPELNYPLEKPERIIIYRRKE